MNKERVIQKFKKKQKHIEASRKWGKKRLKEWNEKHKLIFLPTDSVYPKNLHMESIIEIKPLFYSINIFADRYKNMIDVKKRRQYNRGLQNEAKK